MTKYRVLVVCGTGMGSSMLLKIMVDQVVIANNLPLIVESEVAAAAKSSKADFLIAGLDLVPALKNTGKPAIGIKNMIDKNEILEGLKQGLAILTGDETFGEKGKEGTE